VTRGIGGQGLTAVKLSVGGLLHHSPPQLGLLLPPATPTPPHKLLAATYKQGQVIRVHFLISTNH
jgi:hypothetical protein